MLALLVNVTLSVFKPRGMTPYGQRKQVEQRVASQSTPATSPSLGARSETVDAAVSTPRWVKVFGISIVALIGLAGILKHAADGSWGHGH